MEGKVKQMRRGSIAPETLVNSTLKDLEKKYVMGKSLG